MLGNSATREIDVASLGKANAMAARKYSSANRLFINFTNVAHSAVLSKGGGPVSHTGQFHIQASFTYRIVGLRCAAEASGH